MKQKRKWMVCAAGLCCMAALVIGVKHSRKRVLEV